MLRLTKSYRLLRALNRQPGPIGRAVTGALGYLGTLAFTLRPVLAAGVWRMIVRQGDLKRGLRRVAWFAARSPLGIEPLKDPVFDVTEGMSAQEIAAAQAFVTKRGKGGLMADLDALTVQAAAIRPPMPWEEWNQAMAGLAVTIDRILDQVATLSDGTPGPEAERAGDFPQEAAAEALADFADLFKADVTPWFVISGTYLGLIREGGFLAHDYDIDLGVWENTSLADMAQRARADGRFTALGITEQVVLEPEADQMGLTRQPVLLKLVHRKGVHIDVFMHLRAAGVIWHGSQLHRWVNSPFTLAPYLMSGTDVLGPADPDPYLRENYGDWRTPRTGFNASTGTPNLEMVRNLASLVLFLKRFALARMEGNAEAAGIAEMMLEEGYLQRDGARLTFNPHAYRGTMDGAGSAG